MQVSVEAGDGLVRQMRVELPAEQIEQEIDKRLRDYARSARLPGFRPGKVPLKLLRQRFADGLRGEIFTEQVQATFAQAVTEAALRPAGRPEIEPDVDQAQGRYGYIARFEVLPEVVLAPLAGKSVNRPVAEVTEADIDAMIERLREQRKEWEPVDRAAADGDEVRVAFEGRVDGETFPGGKADDIRLVLGSGRMLPGFEEQLVGAMAGEERIVDVTLPEQYPNETLAGKTASFAVQVREVRAPVLPEVDADFMTAFGIQDGDLARFRADVRGNMERELKQRIEAKLKAQVMDVLIETNPVVLPAVLVSEEIRSLKEQGRRNFGGGAFELPDELYADTARRRVALGLLVAELVKQHQLVPDAARVRAAVDDIARTYEEPASVVEYYYADRQRLAAVESLVLEDLVVERLLTELQVLDEPSSFATLTASA